jgi:hypothetical protein
MSDTLASSSELPSSTRILPRVAVFARSTKRAAVKWNRSLLPRKLPSSTRSVVPSIAIVGRVRFVV